MKLNHQKLKIIPTEIIQNSVLNRNTMKSEKYGLPPKEIERQSFASEQCKPIFNMQKKIKKDKKISKN